MASLAGLSDRIRSTNSLRSPARRRRHQLLASDFLRATPNAYLVLATDLTIMDMNEPYARATLIRPDEVVGRHMFDVFPDNPEFAEADGVSNLACSLRTVIAERRPHEMAVQRYDIRDRDGRFLERHWRPSNHPMLDERTGHLACIIHSAVDVTEEVRRRLFREEAIHRYRNMFCKLRAIISRTSADAQNVEALTKALRGRIEAMERAHLRLDAVQWSSLAVKVLFDDELRPYCTRSNVVLDGPYIQLEASAARSLSMVVHELTTNAAKYGALSKIGGRVVVRWTIEQADNGASVLAIVWQEENGPRIDRSPSRKGLGGWIIRDLLRLELGARVNTTYDAEGLRCEIALPPEVFESGALGFLQKPMSSAPATKAVDGAFDSSPNQAMRLEAAKKWRHEI